MFFNLFVFKLTAINDGCIVMAVIPVCVSLKKIEEYFKKFGFEWGAPSEPVACANVEAMQASVRHIVAKRLIKICETIVRYGSLSTEKLSCQLGTDTTLPTEYGIRAIWETRSVFKHICIVNCNGNEITLECNQPWSNKIRAKIFLNGNIIFNADAAVCERKFYEELTLEEQPVIYEYLNNLAIKLLPLLEAME